MQQTGWEKYWKEKRNKNRVLISLSALTLTLFLFVKFLTYNETRSGFCFPDPVLHLFKPYALSEYTFFITYVLGIYGLITCAQKPHLFLRLIQAYTIMTLLRMGCMFLLPLEPPATIIPLRDSFLRHSFYSGRENLKDLFFSGHTATICLFVFIFENVRFKWFYAVGAAAVGMLLILQHVHYSIDVMAAPLFAWLGVFIQKKVFS
ncbi:MAG: phosphatase PAP2-related protein [Bacteroidia bacterium]